MTSALITGTSKGIGLATAVAMGRAGHKVYATMRNPGGAPELASIVDKEDLPVTISVLGFPITYAVKWRQYLAVPVGTGSEVSSGPGRLKLEGRIPAETFEALGSWATKWKAGDSGATPRGTRPSPLGTR